ncbi:hypothetical protein MLD38_001574 [Melastoma candidum]|uniref:Uncharacterized protein n=1 Tax=Melastoma candidum TaxID=119954 RepID=A0ACB9SDS9_9MYRT|nr:hypothetical protein MLD38_001574 [Melastoma candidum]
MPCCCFSASPCPSSCSPMLLRHADVENYVYQTAGPNALIGALRRRTRSRACSSARSAARRASVSLQVLTATRSNVLATTTGRPRRDVPSAPKTTRRLRSLAYVPWPVSNDRVAGRSMINRSLPTLSFCSGIVFEL